MPHSLTITPALEREAIRHTTPSIELSCGEIISPRDYHDHTSDTGRCYCITCEKVRAFEAYWTPTPARRRARHAT